MYIAPDAEPKFMGFRLIVSWSMRPPVATGALACVSIAESARV